MGWLARLSEEASAKAAEVLPGLPAPPAKPAEIRQVTVTVRNGNGTDGDPGEVAIGYYTVANGILTMVDEAGKTIGQPIALGPVEAADMARTQTRKRWDGDGFNRRLEYSPLGIV